MTTKENVLKILLETDGFVSGENLAGEIGVSRNAVWKAVRSLRAKGFEIEAATNRGYSLSSEGIALNEIVIRHYLNANKDRDICILKSVDSTNNYAKKLAAEGAGHGTLVTAETQTAGKGRTGRSFCSPVGGNIYMSVVLRPDINMQSSQLITSCIAAAAADAVDRICQTDVGIKWVNDLFLNGKKICGILTEASVNFENDCLDYAVAGIGINLCSVKNTFPPELLDIVTSVEDETGNIPVRSRLIAEILNNIDKYMKNIEKKKFLEEYRRRSFIVGNRVVVSKFQDERMAQAIGISDDAGLIVRYDDGTEEILNSGEARIVRQNGTNHK
ncbi:MAG: biotin--[acetyl-CoA-carboxylase] ligase [Clostridium sp.]|nr:biotin--[acetyl-CoA-carboxylase] ligase [Clostridium sp.]MCM1547850.1 biotin--[acetyl-CoA-carboxylase] ligase [Ruminococcus sp.]